MCTLAWEVSGEDFWICFNRDEQRSRPEAEAPVIDRSGKYPVMYPRDPQGGGTWLAVSKAGFVVALMNHYSGNPVNNGGLRSRGGIVLKLIHSSSIDSAIEKLSGIELTGKFAPFHLFIFSRKGGKQWTWDGDKICGITECPKFWTTSSCDPESICQWRTDQWEKLTGGKAVSADQAGAVLRMRGSPPACGMTMDREDARTVSQSIIEMNGQNLVFSYARREARGSGFEESMRSSW